MYNELQAAMPSGTVVKMSKSGGVVPRDTDAREAARLSHVKQYYYGSPGQGALHPALPVVHFDDVFIFKIGAPAVYVYPTPPILFPHLFRQRCCACCYFWVESGAFSGESLTR